MSYVFRTALAASMAVIALSAAHSAAASPKVGQPAPAFSGVTINGKPFKSSDFKGDVVVINFWATWCAPCRKELPLLDAYYKVQSPYGLRVLFVTTEDSASVYDMKPLAKVMTAPLVPWFHGGYGVLDGVPTNYVIDRKGVLRYAKAGAFSLEDLNDLLVPLLQEAAPDPNAAPAPATASPPLSASPAAASASSRPAEAPRSG